MIEMIHCMFVEPWTSRYTDWFDRIMSILMATILVFLVVFVGCTAYELADWVGIDRKTQAATIVSTQHSPGYMSLIVHSDGKNTWTTPIWIPDSYRAYVKTPETSEWVSMGAGDYSQLRNGDVVQASCGIGRLSGKMRIVSFSY